MVQIKIKGINGQLHIFMRFADWEEGIRMLSIRLEELSAHARGTSAFFHLPDITEEEVRQLFSLCASWEILIAGIEAERLKRKEEGMQVLEQKLYNGQQYELKKETLLLGNIERQAFVMCEHSLYVLGSVEGSVDLLHEQDVLCASCMDASVRICDTKFQNVTVFSPVKVYYERGSLKWKAYKEERMWEKQSQ